MIRQRLCLLTLAAMAMPAIAEESPTPTREFAIENDRAFLGGQEVKLWGLRCGNALNSEAITERHIRNFDNMVAHGINVIGVYIQGSNAGWPDADAALNGFTRGFTTAWPPNKKTPGGPGLAYPDVNVLTRRERIGGTTFGAITSRSYHPGGVHALRCDGSVRFTAQSIDGRIWRALGTIAGGEVISNDEM